MRELRSCEFCGETGARAYEVLPATIEGGPRRMVLCDDCRVTLESVLDPLLDTQSERRRDRDPDRTDASSGSSDDPVASGDDPDSSSSVQSVRPDPSSSETGSQDRPSSSAEDHDTTASGSDQTSEEDGITILRDEDGQSETAEHPDATGSSATESRNTDGDDVDTSGSQESTDRTASSAGGDTGKRTEEPEGFRRAMRLLNNREFPVDRSDFIALATGAYDMDDSQVEAIIDHAVDRGVLVENGGQLERG